MPAVRESYQHCALYSIILTMGARMRGISLACPVCKPIGKCTTTVYCMGRLFEIC